MKLLSDRQLEALAPLRLPIVGRRLARRAAARALHAAALAGAPDDAAVLALLGLHAAAVQGRGDDPSARRGRAVAAAALTGAAAGDAAAWPLAWRRRLAAAIAPHDPLAAAELLPDLPLAALACRLAAGEASPPPDPATGAEAALLAAALTRGAERADAIAVLFGRFGLARPLGRDGGTRLTDYAPEVGEGIADGPLVSAVVPMRDAAATIELTLEALTRQSWRQLEIIVVDDGSTDDGAERVRRRMAADRRIRLLENRNAPGASGARNTAIAAAQGRYLAFLDADDWSPPERIARQMATIAAGAGSAAATVSTHYRVDEAEGRPVAPRVFPLIRLCPISMLVRRDALIAAGPFEIALTGADAELLGRLDTLCGRRAVPRDPAPLTIALWRSRSLSNDRDNPLAARDRTLYREQWMRGHVTMRGRGLPRLGPAS